MISQTRMMPFNGLAESGSLDVVLTLCSLSSPRAFWAGLCTLVPGISMMRDQECTSDLPVFVPHPSWARLLQVCVARATTPIQPYKAAKISPIATRTPQAFTSEGPTNDTSIAVRLHKIVYKINFPKLPLSGIVAWRSCNPPDLLFCCRIENSRVFRLLI